MSEETIAVLARSIERILICLFGGTSLVLGWNLFRIGVVQQQTAELKAGNWSANLQKVGPGVFFALFGAAILIVLVRAQLTVPSPNPKGSVVMYYGEQDETRARHLARSINTVRAYFVADKSGNPSPVDRALVEQAIQELLDLRNDLGRRALGDDLFSTYQASVDRYVQDPARVSQKEREAISSLTPWMQDTLLAESPHP